MEVKPQCPDLTKLVPKVLARRGCKSLVLQVGQGRLVPITEKNGIKIESFSLKPSISDDISRADLVISHAGAGSCLGVLSARKPLIVVVNEDLMDNHQEELANKLQDEGYLFQSNCANLVNVLENLDINELKPFNPGDPKKYAQHFDTIMGFSS
ncbi:UDP-N-acetylglucosamine transferase subunit ALG13 [Homalodisca vitripennis]|nr:UDP-N-acetylglucosamine transferase subunit ALG13 [Homalodisca vitripennis]